MRHHIVSLGGSRNSSSGLLFTIAITLDLTQTLFTQLHQVQPRVQLAPDNLPHQTIHQVHIRMIRTVILRWNPVELHGRIYERLRLGTLANVGLEGFECYRLGGEGEAGAQAAAG